MNGKGDNRRPASVSVSEMQARWAATFGAKQGKTDPVSIWVDIVDEEGYRVHLRALAPRPAEDQ
jgi:hypothetical protein